jgi:hypothetical protein
MNLTAIHSPAATPALAAVARVSTSPAETFAERLAHASHTQAPQRERAREAAEQLVATSLVTPLLAQLRDQPLDAKLFHGGIVEDAFRQKLDTILADRIVRSGKFPLVDRVYERVMRHRPATAPEGVNTHA